MNSTSFDIAVIGTWVAFFLSLISLVGVIRAHFTSGTKENSQAIGVLSEKHGSLNTRVQKIESKIEYLPSKDDFTALSVSLAHIQGDMKAIVQTSKSAKESAQRVENFLLKKGAEK